MVQVFHVHESACTFARWTDKARLNPQTIQGSGDVIVKGAVIKLAQNWKHNFTILTFNKRGSKITQNNGVISDQNKGRKAISTLLTDKQSKGKRERDRERWCYIEGGNSYANEMNLPKPRAATSVAIKTVDLLLRKSVEGSKCYRLFLDRQS